MPNVNHPHGLNAVMSRVHDTPRLTKYYANVTAAIYRGDVVCLTANGRVASQTTNTAVNQVGVAANYNPAGTTPAKEIWVYDDPDTVFEIQSDGTTDPGSVAAAVAHIGGTAAVTMTAGDASSGQSKFELKYSSIGTTTTGLPLKIVGLYNISGNDPSLAKGRYLVMLNRHIYAKGTPGI